jgi:prepilin-type N-terminal cleavage/methylation domain-containing protein
MLKKAFSLIELSIAAVVISILIVGFLNVSSGKNSNNKVKITIDRIDTVYKSLGEFVLKNKRLPCPASIKAIKTGDVNYGIEGTAAGTCTGTAGTGGVYLSTASGATNMVYGMIPVKALGLSNDYGEDGFGSKFAYIVDKTYTTGTTFSTSSGSILIQKYINGAYTTDSNNAIFAIISYGPNKGSSFNANSSSQNILTSNVDEMFNDPIALNDGTKTADFTQTLVNSSERGTIFDDIVFYKSRDNFLKDSNAANIVNGNITSSANVTAVPICTTTGGGSTDTSTVPGKTIHRFTSNGTLVCTYSKTATILVVGGGGSGGSHNSLNSGTGGGGGGGVILIPSVNLPVATYTITVAGTTSGKEQSSGTCTTGIGNPGNTSNFSGGVYSIIANGGGGGAGCGTGCGTANGNPGGPGGSGGGGHCNGTGGVGGSGNAGSVSGLAADAYSLFANPGGSSSTGGGGGGGALVSGSSGSSTSGGNGGKGYSSSISGISVVYGSGGGGQGVAGGTGGTNAGNGAGGFFVTRNGLDAIANTGSGGGANSNVGVRSGDGASGVVIISY